MAGGTDIFLIDIAADVNAVKSGVLAASVTIDSYFSPKKKLVSVTAWRY